MTEKPLIIDEITTLRLLHDIRAEMQKFSAAPVSSPQNREHLNAMMATLQLTPDEHAEVLQQWEITRVGERTYNRRRCFEALLSSLQYLEDKTPLPVQRENAAENLPQSRSHISEPWE